MMKYDVQAIREHFPSLTSGVAFFDGPGGSQVSQTVADAVSATMTSPISNRGTSTASARRADDVVRAWPSGGHRATRSS
jgi:selenocysteine lyase/cysteine desulfurase